MKAVKHPHHDGMFFAIYPDGVLSHDFYNATRAADHTAVLARPRVGITTRGYGRP
jgi:hypothetical protein